MTVGNRIIHPLPKEQHFYEGFLIFSGELTFRAGSGLPNDVAELWGWLLGNFTAHKLTLHVESDISLPAYAVCTGSTEAVLPDEDSYCVSVNENGVCLGAKDLNGLRYAFYTFLQLLQRRGEESITGFAVPYCFISDAPAMRFRGVHICIFPDTDLLLIEKYIMMAAFTKFNYIVLESWGGVQFDNFPFWIDKGLKKEQMRPLIRRARLMGLEVIPLLNSLGHATASRDAIGKNVLLERKPEMATYLEPYGYDWCISNPAVKTLLKKLRLEMYDLFGPSEYFHIGGDEAYFLATCDRCAAQPFLPLVSGWLNGLCEDISKEGRRPMMWSDMLLDPNDWQGGEFVFANSTPERPTHKLLETLDRRFVITDWQYNIFKGPDRTAAKFMENGFTTILCPWCENPNSGNDTALAASAKEEHTEGVLLTTWMQQARIFPMLAVQASLLWHREPTSFIQPTIISTELLRKLCPSGGLYDQAGWLNGIDG